MIESPDLAALPGIRHAFFTREGGVSQGIYASLNGGVGSNDDPAAVAANRKRMAACLNVPAERMIGLHQVHSAEAVIALAPWPGERPKADGIVTKEANLALGIATADCGPILFADAKARVIGGAHAGWRGAFTGVIEATLKAMEAIGAHRGDIVAVLGPTISRDAYEVGPEFRARFLEADTAHQRFFRPSSREDHFMFDLPAFIGHRMAEAQVGRFVDLGLCTYGDERRFFSYRRTVHRGEPDYGRLIAAIALSPEG